MKRQRSFERGSAAIPGDTARLARWTFSRFALMRAEMPALLDRELGALEVLLKVREEAFRISAIDYPMIKTQREKSHVTNRDVVFTFGRGEHPRPLFDLADSENCHLWLIDDGRAEQPAENAGIRDRESAAGHFVRLELFRARTIGEIVCRARQT